MIEPLRIGIALGSTRTGRFADKPAEWLLDLAGYGNAGGARGIEPLRLMLIELQIAPLRNALHLSREQFIGVLMQGKTFADFPELEKSAGAMLDELLWWARTLRAGREEPPDQKH